MIKINKNFDAIPLSLNSDLTKKRRNELIENGAYIQANIYHSRYKKEDILTVLKVIYHHKCAFCEQKIEHPHVEHFRPKNIYFWLAYSWDNLLLACLGYNSNKNNHFQILAKKETNYSIDEIHSLCKKYNEFEESLFINPEQEDEVETKLTFDTDGNIESDDQPMNYTIKTCRLDRTYLVNSRKKVFDDFKRKLYMRFLTEKPYEVKMESIKDLIQDFIADANDPQKEYLAFRRYIINNNLIPKFDNALG